MLAFVGQGGFEEELDSSFISVVIVEIFLFFEEFIHKYLLSIIRSLLIMSHDAPLGAPGRRALRQIFVI